MTAIFASVVAVLGTLLGSLATYAIQRSTVRQQQALAGVERRRQERVDAIAVYAEALTTYRRVRMDRWHSVNEDRDDQDTLRRQNYEVRAAAVSARLRVELLVEDQELRKQCRLALEVIEAMRPGITSEEFDQGRNESRTALTRLVDAARKFLEQAQPG
ncbi:hypothetical protein [Nocardioides panzhihuensis]|uniref:Uncharacterized protein n=1 Tax=Nocardioides panzhihuensis TaxID=860243 RepID=A0A7Z0ITR2_9ACTN|nr:hypothetical protein [Nocardioides panzhihuensis]NYI79083.1 hypothetical protein [Nocardioides panzhihuensis]